jgi:outer membrane lipoprotein-sorting protein
MIRLSFILNIAACCMLLGIGSVPQSSAPQEKPADSGNLDAVLKKMDAAAASFRNAQADFEWDTYEKVIDEVDEIQTGTIYFRRTGKDIEMMAAVKKAGSDLAHLAPELKYVLYNNGTISMYLPKPDQLTVYDLGKQHVDLESYVVLGFGGSGQDLMKAFDVSYVGPETLNGVATAKLQLIPKSDKVRNTYNKIFLWIDLDKGVSLQQQFFSSQGDYRLTKYSSIQLNEKKISDDVFKLKTTSKTQMVSPKG